MLYNSMTNRGTKNIYENLEEKKNGAQKRS